MFIGGSSAQRRRTQLGINVLVWVILLFLAIPAVWIILTAFRTNAEVNASPAVWIPKELTLEAFANIFGLHPEVESAVAVQSYMINSITAAVISTILAVSAGTLAGYGFARFHFRGHTALFLLLIFSRCVPGIALGIPLFLLFVKIGLVNNIYGLAFVYTAVNIPFTVWLMDGFFRQIPRDLTEAAYMDGCSRWLALLRVELPLAGPGIAASAIFAFLAAWNEFQIAGIITRSNDARTFPPGLFAFTAEFTIDWRGMCAMSVLMMIPAVIFVILTQRNLVRGLTFGAVKG